MPIRELANRVMEGDQRALARMATILERGGETADQTRRLILSLQPEHHALESSPKSTHIVGISGPPGAGKSSLLATLATHLSGKGVSVAILAIDPTSPVTGGAMLGDRIRMSEAALLPGVFVRSVAARSRLDGLSPAIADLVLLFQFARYDWIFVETVGSGQNQFAIADYVHTLVLVEAPGAGDGVQMLKAGIMELADIYAVTKSDQPGAHLIARELRAMLALGEREDGWTPAVVLTSAENGDGMSELVAAMAEHHACLQRTGAMQDRRLRMARSAIRSRMEQSFDEVLDTDHGRSVIASVAAGDVDLESAVALMLTPMRSIASPD